MDKIGILLICILSGLLIRRFKLVAENTYVALNDLLVNFFLPLLIVYQIVELKFNSKYILPILVSWIIFAVGFCFFNLVGKLFNFSQKSIAALIITAGISSISFLGFPIFEMLYGKEGLQTGILMSQAGSFLIAITLGIGVASWYSSKTPSLKNIFYNLIKFPPFIAFMTAMGLNYMDIHFSNQLNDVLAKLSSPYLVIALLSVGLQIDLTAKDVDRRLLSIGLFYKLILAPLLIFILYYFIFGLQNFMLVISVLGAAIGPMNTAAIIAERHNLDGKLASKLVAFGIPLSLPIIYILYLLLELL